MAMGKLVRIPPKKAKKNRVATVSTVKRLIRQQQETHHHNEYGASGTNINTTGTIINLSDIAQGDTDMSRTGDVISLKNAFGNYSIIAGTSGTVTVVRLIWFQWRMDNGAEAPTIGDILFDTTNVPYLSNYKVDMSKFKVLADRMHYVGPIGGDANMLSRKISLRNFNKRLMYDAGGTNGKNQIYLLVIGNNASGATAPNMYYHFRLTFTDS